MRCKLVVTTTGAASAPATNEDQTTTQVETQQPPALRENTKCDTELTDLTQVQIGDQSMAEIVNGIKTLLGEDTSTTVFIPNKKLGEAGVVTILAETGKKIVFANDKEKNNEEKQGEGKEKGKGKGKGKGKEMEIVSGTMGSFNSTQVRNWWQLASKCDWKEVSFYGLENRVMDGVADKMDMLVGLNWLDFDCWKDLRIKAFAEPKDYDCSNTDSFKIKLETWGDSTMWSSGCNWIALPHMFASATRIQYGSFNTMKDHPRDRPQPVTTRDVTFAREYAEEDGVPNVAIWFNSLDISKGNEMYQVQTWASNVSRKGFKINIVCKKSTTLWSAGVSWLSYPSGEKTIDSARFEITESLGGRKKSEKGKVAFKDRIMRQVFVGLNELETGGWKHTRVNVTAKPGIEEVEWKVDTWLDTVLQKVGGTIIVLGELTGSTPLKYVYQ